jgi:hypothetical protein
MKLPKLSFPFILLFIAFVFSQCKKEPVSPNTDDGLPPATQTGANIFACKVNGQNWISKTGSSNLGGGIINDSFFCIGSNPLTTNFLEAFEVRVNNYSSSQYVYTLSDTINQYAKFTTNNSCFEVTGGSGIGRGKSYNGVLTLTKVDNTNKILSGNFWFNIKTDYCDTIKVTNGRFDIRYY